jgi:hypothetical protein
MKLKALISTALTALAITTTGALGEKRVLEKSDNWHSFFGHSSPSNTPVCSMESFGNDKVEGRTLSVTIKAFRDMGLWVQLYKIGGWKFPKNQRIAVPLEIWFDKTHVLDADAYGYLDSSSHTVVEFRVAGEMIHTFLNNFRDANRMMFIRFTQGNEGYWTVGLAGIGAISDSFASCIRDVKNGIDPLTKPEPTQPYSTEARPAPAVPWENNDAKPPVRPTKNGEGSL